MELTMDRSRSVIWMNGYSFSNIYFVVIMVLVHLFAAPWQCVAQTDFKAALLVSKKIKPYIHVAEGVTGGIEDDLAEMDIFFLSPGEEKLNHQILTDLKAGQYDLVAAIGPEAASMVWTKAISSKRFYVAVLNPESVSGLGADACGISLRIPVELQLRKIAQTFLNIHKIGLIFDPRHNQWFFEQAAAAALDHGIEITAFSVSSKKQIADILKERSGTVDAIWMIPDQTVISEKIIHYVIKQGIYNKAGVIGYNSFFSRSGAFFSFEFDYKSLGQQAGKQMSMYLKTGQCRKVPPVFNTIVNRKIAEKIGLRVNQ